MTETDTITHEDIRDFSVSKQILWESADDTDQEVNAKEVKYILVHCSNGPRIGYNKWLKLKGHGSGNN